jgi:hypothetical protein
MMRVYFLLPLALGMAACATGTLPAAQLEASSASIRAAEEAGSKDVPLAALHLQLAKEQSEQAKRFANRGDVERGTRFLLRAEADADLAFALAQGKTAQAGAEDASEQIQKLNQETP